MEQGSGREPIPEGQIGIQELYQRRKCRNMSSQSKTFQVICELECKWSCHKNIVCVSEKLVASGV